VLFATGLLAIAMLLLALHGGALRWSFISDDFILLDHVLHRTAAQVLFDPRVDQSYFRPLGREAYFLTLSRLAGPHPFAFHLANFALLLSCAALVMALGARLFGPRAGLLAAACYALLHTHRVLIGWVSCAQDLIATLFGVLAVLLHLRGRRVLGAFAFGAAMLAKESVALLPLALFVTEFARTSRGERADARIKRAVVAIAPYAVVGAAWLALVMSVRAWKHTWAPGDTMLVADVSFHPANLIEALRTALLAPIALDPPWRDLTLTASRTALPWIAMAIAAALGFLATRFPAGHRDARRGRTATASPLNPWLLATLWLVLGAIPPALAGHHISSYYLSFAAVGAALIAGGALSRAQAIVPVLLLPLLAMTNAWANGVEHFRAEPNEVGSAGLSLVTAHRLEIASDFLSALETSLRRDPPDSNAVIYLSHVSTSFTLATGGNRALDVWFGSSAMGFALLRDYRPGASARPATFLSYDEPHDRFVRVPRGLVDALTAGEDSLTAGRPRAARTLFESALTLARTPDLDRQRAELLNDVGVAASQMYDTAAARSAWQATLATDPTHVDAALNLIALLARDGRFAEALPLARSAVDGHPDHPRARVYLVRIERTLGHDAEANRLWSEYATRHPAQADSVVRAQGAP
jgi:tetratricopeptide (TPR) repeat protein